MGSSEDDIRSDLEQIERLIASLTSQETERSEETPDGADAASDLTTAAEDAAVLDLLRKRRDRLRAQLGEDPEA